MNLTEELKKLDIECVKAYNTSSIICYQSKKIEISADEIKDKTNEELLQIIKDKYGKV